MEAIKEQFLLYDDTYELIYSRLVMANLNPHIKFRVIEFHPVKMSYLCEVTNGEETWWQWINLNRGYSRKMYVKPNVKRKKDPTLV